jgi:hypothetical protein
VKTSSAGRKGQDLACQQALMGNNIFIICALQELEERAFLRSLRVVLISPKG